MTQLVDNLVAEPKGVVWRCFGGFFFLLAIFSDLGITMKKGDPSSNPCTFFLVLSFGCLKLVGWFIKSGQISSRPRRTSFQKVAKAGEICFRENLVI